MLKDKYSYIALFTYEDAGISIEFPDLPGCYPCADKDNTDDVISFSLLQICSRRKPLL